MTTFVWLPMPDIAFQFSMANNPYWRYLSPQDGGFNTNPDTVAANWSDIKYGDTIKIVGHSRATDTSVACWETAVGQYTVWSYEELAQMFAANFRMRRGAAIPTMDIHLQFCWSASSGMTVRQMTRVVGSAPGRSALSQGDHVLNLQRIDSFLKKFVSALRHIGGFDRCRVTGYTGEVVNHSEFPVDIVDKTTRYQYAQNMVAASQGLAEPYPSMNPSPAALAANLQQGRGETWSFRDRTFRKHFATFSKSTLSMIV